MVAYSGLHFQDYLEVWGKTERMGEMEVLMMALWKQMRWSPSHLGEFLTGSVNCQDVLKKQTIFQVKFHETNYQEISQ